MKIVISHFFDKNENGDFEFCNFRRSSTRLHWVLKRDMLIYNIVIIKYFIPYNQVIIMWTIMVPDYDINTQLLYTHICTDSKGNNQ